MAEAVLSSVNSFSAQDYSESFFASVPSDERFLSSSYQKVTPESNIDGRTITFVLSRYQASNIYLIQDCALEMQCVILKADNTLPLKTAQVAPCANVLHSAFEAIRVYINDVCVTPFPSQYHLKSYISNTLTYSAQVKASLLESQGYYGDLSGFFDRTDDFNSGFYSRNRLFRKNFKKDGDYRKEGTRFFGKLNLDFASLDTGLLPGKYKFL